MADIHPIDQDLADQLRSGAKRLVADSTDHARTRKLRRTLPGHDAELLATIAELGWFGILIPEELGGFGFGLDEMALIAGALEKGLISGPFLELAVLGTRTLVHAAGDAAAGLFAEMAMGQTRLALALGHDAALPEVTAGKEGGEWVLKGECAAVAGAFGATHFLVPASDGATLRLFLVTAGAAGADLQPTWRADDSPLGHLSLNGVRVAAETAPAERVAPAIARALDETRIVAAAALNGLSEHMYEMTVEYLKIRRQFDQPIGAFQALQHKAVDLHIQKELATATLSLGLDLARTEPDQLDVAAIRAKGRASAVAMRMGRDAIHLHGAIGFTDEHDLGLYVKRAMVLSAWLGNATAQRRRFVEKGLVFA